MNKCGSFLLVCVAFLSEMENTILFKAKSGLHNQKRYMRVIRHVVFNTKGKAEKSLIDGFFVYFRIFQYVFFRDGLLKI